MSTAAVTSTSSLQTQMPNQNDIVRIDNLVLDCIIGINEWERLTKQRISVDIEIEADLSNAGSSDQIEDTVNYRTISKAVIEMVESSSFGLVEALAQSIADICLSDPLSSAAHVKVTKPGAVRRAKSVGVEIYRSR